MLPLSSAEAAEGDGTGLIAPHEAVSACLQGLQAGRTAPSLFAQALPPEQAARVPGSIPRWDSAASLSVITLPKLGEVAVRYSARLQYETSRTACMSPSNRRVKTLSHNEAQARVMSQPYNSLDVAGLV